MERRGRKVQPSDVGGKVIVLGSSGGSGAAAAAEGQLSGGRG